MLSYLLSREVRVTFEIDYIPFIIRSYFGLKMFVSYFFSMLIQFYPDSHVT